MGILVVIVIIVAVLVVGAVAFVAARRRREATMEAHRVAATQARDLAKVSQVEAERHAAEADERAARARREQLAAEQQKLEAAASLSDAEELHEHADSIDPDVAVEDDRASQG